VDDGDAGEEAEEAGPSWEESWGVMNKWWRTDGYKLRQAEATKSRVVGTLLCIIEELHNLLTGVTGRKAAGKPASEEEMKKIHALSRTIDASEEDRKPKYGVGFLHYMIALRHAIVYELVTVLASAKDAQAPKTEAAAGVDVAAPVAPEEGGQFEVLKTEPGVGRFGDMNVYEIKKDRRTGEVREYMNGKPGKVLHDYRGARLAGLLRQLQECS
jgi:hypothetical protein